MNNKSFYLFWKKKTKERINEKVPIKLCNVLYTVDWMHFLL